MNKKIRNFLCNDVQRKNGGLKSNISLKLNVKIALIVLSQATFDVM